MRSFTAAFVVYVCTLLAVIVQAEDLADGSVDEVFINTSITAAELSVLAKESNPSSTGYDIFEVFAAGSDRVIVAKKDGICFAAFSSNLQGAFEWLFSRFGSLIGNAFETVCNTDNSLCCEVRSQIVDSYQSNDFDTALTACVETCDDPDNCTVFTGHQQGGGVANAAGVEYAALNPLGITFGAPKVLREGGCEALDSEKWYRFVNAVQSQYTNPIITAPSGLFYDQLPLSYDDVPLRPFISCVHIGQLLVLAYGSSFASIGLDSQQEFRPKNDKAGKMTVADSDRTNRGYLDRLLAIRQEYTTGNSYPVPLGYADSSLCTNDKECANGNCAQKTLITPRRCIG